MPAGKSIERKTVSEARVSTVRTYPKGINFIFVDLFHTFIDRACITAIGRTFRTALRTNQITGFDSASSWKK